MKNLILVFTLFSVCVFSQFKVTESSEDWQIIGNHYNTIYLYKNNNKAKIHYLEINSVLNKNPTEYDFIFSVDDKTLDEIYKIIEEHFKTKKEETLTLEFPEGKMYLNFFNSLGYTFVFQFDKNNGIVDKNNSAKLETYGLNINRVNKLFGKK